MTDESDKIPPPEVSIVERLVNETGITEKQARELIGLLGSYSWTSLIREARLLRPKR
jgi:hypothetical protein